MCKCERDGGARFYAALELVLRGGGQLKAGEQSGFGRVVGSMYVSAQTEKPKASSIGGQRNYIPRRDQF